MARGSSARTALGSLTRTCRSTRRSSRAWLISPDIPHKSDVGGVALDLGDATAVRRAYRRVIAAACQHHPAARVDGATMQQMVLAGQEVIVGAVRDDQFGALAMFGAGGVEVEGKGAVAVDVRLKHHR